MEPRMETMEGNHECKPWTKTMDGNRGGNHEGNHECKPWMEPWMETLDGNRGGKPWVGAVEGILFFISLCAYFWSFRR